MPNAWLARTLLLSDVNVGPNLVPNRCQSLVAACCQVRYTVAPNSGTLSCPIPAHRRAQFRYQFWSKSGHSFGQNMVTVFDEIWSQFWMKSGSKLVPVLGHGRQSTQQNGPSLSSKMVRTLIVFGQFYTTQNAYMPGRASKRSFFIIHSIQNRSTCQTAKQYQFSLAKVVSKMVCTSS